MQSRPEVLTNAMKGRGKVAENSEKTAILKANGEQVPRKPPPTIEPKPTHAGDDAGF